jgi:hypothetical protein
MPVVCPWRTRGSSRNVRSSRAALEQRRHRVHGQVIVEQLEAGRSGQFASHRLVAHTSGP